MSDAARRLGEDLARAMTPAGAGGTISAQVVDVTEAGTVNLEMRGALITDVPCTDAYRARAAGDWVAVRPGARPVVLWRLGEDPGEADEAQVRQYARDESLDVQVVRAATWGSGAPSGAGWQTVNGLYMRKSRDGKVELYAQVDNPTDTSPEAPAEGAPKPVSISPNSSGSWRGGRPDEYADYPMQGDWTGRGNRRGGWFYGSKIADACAGKTVAKMTVAFTRRSGSGRNSKVPMHLYLHDHTSPPGGQLDLDEGPENLLSLSTGAKGTAPLPGSWANKLATGAARGLAIYANGSRDYAAFTRGTIRITFT
ncbi:hypothetical protein RM572_22015 [Streptomyces sp. DSM 42041]|uniref:Minor tail protein n=1 Tax=Streptomyces hazeniae TaxID=3075538 RepID=A0ABU2NXH2_9ACTN|nr:hypothetical protein [Streptomyces sp. DSM 42041]MDT0381439.1 hypothetical protein [Streptomyces sp. DSM 42041]